MARILYTVNIPRFFVSHRLPLALAARQAGYDVHVATSDADSEHTARIRASGLAFHPLPLAQHGTSPLTELRTLQALIQLYRQLQPDLVHHVSIKPVLYGGIAARLTGVKAVVGAMSGLGYVFVGTGSKPRLLRQIVRPLFRLALGHRNTRMIFQNQEDLERFTQMGLIQAQHTALIRGSGVDVDLFTPQPEAAGMPLVLFAGRLMWQKGIGAFVEAARALHTQARFVIAGYAEATSPDTVPEQVLQAWAAEGIVEWWGKRDDMPQVFAQSHLVVLPSTYGEGVPKVLIEAAACGRALVTTHTAGCRDICRDGENGLLVAPDDHAALIAAIRTLLDDAPRRQQMGAAGRALVLRDFSLEVVVRQTLSLYQQMLSGTGKG
jgi:glycosyltransferase involved in cell wall biosynthesis